VLAFIGRFTSNELTPNITKRILPELILITAIGLMEDEP